ncbi:zinc finger E-box-binding homeobox protein zag-1-like, partial [Anoplophora glabripennis]|uniref:zinc finger E-box-binding homeobox protein zag-1-like n=1 Tax=Anoplophora glabripennis TaxID=217634 RepID=UPI000874823A
PRPFQCPDCGKFYSYNSGLIQHRKYMCGKEAQFQCPIQTCSYKSQLRSNLRKHIKAKHHQNPEMVMRERNTKKYEETNKDCRQGQRFFCPRCNSSYKIRRSLRRHMNYECGVEPSFPCQYCSKRFKHKADLKIHLVRNRCKKQPLLDLNSQKANSINGKKEILVVNIVSKSIKEYIPFSKIDVSQISSSSSATFVPIVLEDVELPQQNCTTEISVFSCLNKLVFILLGQAYFKCLQCFKSYKHRTNLVRHRRLECNKAPSYHCPVCNLLFKHKHHLQKHQERQHSVQN